MVTFRGRLRYALWAIGACVGPRVSARTPAKATVLITYFQPVRMADARLQIRSVLRCRFVERIVVSNHNPAVAIDAVVGLQNPRLRHVHQDVARPCGFRWQVARGPPEVPPRGPGSPWRASRGATNRPPYLLRSRERVEY